MLAALTTLPVIGVPLSGAVPGCNLDMQVARAQGYVAQHQQQLPQGVPMAVVALDGAQSAALLSIRMLASLSSGIGAISTAGKQSLGDKLEAFIARQESKVISSAARLDLVGIHKFFS
jgi:5-(carboxyamino)imidazole ribonucleotide mutase